MRIINAVIRRIFAIIRLSFIKMFNFDSIKFKIEELISVSTHFELMGGKLELGKKVCTKRNCSFAVYGNSKLVVEDGCFFNNNCMIACHDYIRIGEGTSFGPACIVYDHDHDFRAVGGKKSNKYKMAPIIIGKNVWIGANCTILKGVEIGDNVVIAAGTVITKSIPKNAIVYQKKSTIIKKYIPNLGG